MYAERYVILRTLTDDGSFYDVLDVFLKKIHVLNVH